MKFDSILGTVGNTPHVKINRLAPDHVDLYVKIEAFNPLGAVKDRLALGVIEAAEKSGELKPGQTVIEATSGNTGIGLAMVCAAKGYPFVCTMAEPFSVERRKLMRFLGAKEAHQLAPLDRERLGHGADERIAFRGAHHRKPDAGVAGGRLDHGLAGFQLARFLRCLDDAEREAVLYRAEGIERLDLDEQLHVIRREPVDAHARGVADGSQDALELGHEGLR